jgi:hypothetical protein
MKKYLKMTSSLNGDKNASTDCHSSKDNNHNIVPQFKVSTAAEKLQISQNAQKKMLTTTVSS